MSLPRLALRLTKNAFPVLLLLTGLIIASTPASAAATYTFYVSGTAVGATNPGVAKDYTLNITNLNSSASISFNLSITASPLAWTTQLSQTALTVGPSATRQVTLTVQPPSSALADAVGQYVNVTATPDDNTTSQTVSTTTRVNEVVGVSVTLIPNAGTSGDPGVNITWLAYVKNTGNSVQTYSVNINNTSFTSTNLTTSLVTISPGENRVVLVTINISTTAPVGVLYSRITATAQSNSSVTDAQLFSASVNPKRAVALAGVTPDDLKASTESESSVQLHNILVQNVGNIADSYTIQGSANASRHGDWVTFEYTTVFLSGFTQRYLNVTVTVPASASATGDYTVEFRIISDNSTTTIAFLNLTITVVTKHDLSLAYDGLVGKQSGEPGTVVAFPIIVTNAGGYDQRVDLSYTGSNPSWLTISANPFLLSAGANRTIYYTFTIPGGQAPSSFNFTVKGTINWTNPYRNRTVDLTLEIKQLYDLVATSSVAEGSGLPGATVPFTINVRNTGTGTDTFTVTSSNTTQAGLVTVTGGNPTLAPGASANVTVSLAIALSPQPAAGVYYYAVTAKSSGNVTKTSLVNLAVTVNQTYALVTAVGPSYKLGVPGTIVTYNLSVTNNGNGPDTITLERAGNNQTWVNFPVGSGTIASGGKMNFTVEVMAPSYAAAGDTLLTAKAVSGGNLNVSSSSTFTVSLGDHYEHAITTAGGVGNAHRNTTYLISVTVRNAGNKPDTYTLSVEGPDASWATLPFATVALNPDEDSTFLLPVLTPGDPSNGPHTIILNATSVFNTSWTEVTGFNITLNDNFHPNVIVITTALFAQPFTTVQVRFNVRNDGTITDTFQITATTPPALNQVFSTSATLAPGFTTFQTFSVYLSYPFTGSYEIVIHAVSQGNVSYEDYGFANITMDVVRTVSLTASSNYENGGPGIQTPFNLMLNNTGNITDTYNMSYLAPFAGWTVTFSVSSLTLAPGGLATLTVWVQPPDNSPENPLGVTIYATSTTAITTQGVLLLNLLVDYSHNLTGGGATSLLPGASSNFLVTLSNDGTSAENYTITVTGPAAAWVTLSDVLVRLDAGTQTTVGVTVNVPSNQHDGTRAFNVEARGQHLPAASVAAFTVNVRQVFGLQVTSASGAISVFPNQTATFPISVLNTGNTNDTYTFLATPLQFVTVSPANATADAGQMRNFSVQFTPGASLPAGPVAIQVTVFAGGGNFVVVDLQAVVRQFYNLTAKGQPSGTFAGAGAPGGQIQLAFNISNRGNGPDTFSWFVSGDAAPWAEVTSGSEHLNASATTIVTVLVDIPSNPLLALAGSRSLNVTVISQGDSNVTAQITGSVSVSEVSAFTASLDPSSPVLSVLNDVDRAGSSAIDYTIYIHNGGNRVENVQLSRAPITGWVISILVGGSSATSVTIAPGADATATVRIVSFPVSAVDNTVSVRASVADAAAAPVSLSISLHFLLGNVIINDNSLQVSETSVNAGSRVSVTFTVTNNGLGTATGVQVELLVDGQERADQKTLAPIAPGATREVTLTWTSTESHAGTSHTMTVHIPDGGEASADSVAVTGVTKGLLSKITSDRDTQLLMVVMVVVGLAIGLAARGGKKRGPAAPLRPAPPPPPAGPDAAMAGIASLEAEGAMTGGPVPVPVPVGAAPVEHKIVCPNCGTEQWVKGAEGECKTCGVIIEVEEEPETLSDPTEGI